MNTVTPTILLRHPPQFIPSRTTSRICTSPLDRIILNTPTVLGSRRTLTNLETSLSTYLIMATEVLPWLQEMAILDRTTPTPLLIKKICILRWEVIWLPQLTPLHIMVLQFR